MTKNVSKTSFIISNPYNFHLSMTAYAYKKVQAVDYYTNRRYRRVVSYAGQVSLVDVFAQNINNSVKITVQALEPKQIILPQTLGIVRKILLPKIDLEHFYKLLADDLVTRRLTKMLLGFVPPQSPTVFEALIVAITEQQVSLASAMAVRKRLSENFGSPVDYEGYKYFSFPEAHTFANVLPEELRRTGLSTRKAETIIAISQAITSEAFDLEDICSKPIDEVLAQLTRFRGIGPWTVYYTLSRGAGRFEFIPATDLVLRASIARSYFGKPSCSEKDVIRLLSKFGKYAGYVALYFIYAHVLGITAPHNNQI